VSRKWDSEKSAFFNEGIFGRGKIDYFYVYSFSMKNTVGFRFECEPQSLSKFLLDDSYAMFYDEETKVTWEPKP
jgi:hypothetical protein